MNVRPVGRADYGLRQMIVCSCNVISDREIRQVVAELLAEDPWRLIVPVQVYHAMRRRGRCCGCFPRVVDLIIETTEAFHRQRAVSDGEIVAILDRLRDEHERCETARRLAQGRRGRSRAA